MHDPDTCFCGDDFTGQCPCPCAKCQDRSIDPVQQAKEEAGARTLLAWIEMLNDRQWKEFERWLILHGPEAAPYFPAFIYQRQFAFAADYPTMKPAEKQQYQAEWQILNEFEAAEAQAEEICASRKRQAGKRYLSRMRRLSQLNSPRLGNLHHLESADTAPV
jgi:hypothetical protein